MAGVAVAAVVAEAVAVAADIDDDKLASDDDDSLAGGFSFSPYNINTKSILQQSQDKITTPSFDDG